MLRKLITDCHGAWYFDKAYLFIYLFIFWKVAVCLTPLGHCTFGIFKVVLFTSILS